MEPSKKKAMIKRLYDAGFPADRAWNDWFFERVYRDEDAMLLAPGGNPVSCLLLQRYRFGYTGGDVPMGYISGATTLNSSRSRGYMSGLMGMALTESYNRGDVFVGLIPATRRLYNYYDRFGFATVIYTDIERYTSVHNFATDADYAFAEPSCDILQTLEQTRPAGVRHSADDFAAILEDIAHDHGAVSAVVDNRGLPAAIAFATPGRIENHVRELLAVDDHSAEMALAGVRDAINNGLPMEVWCKPEGRIGSLRARGMLRIVNVAAALQGIAAHHPRTEQVIRVRDSRIPDNNGVFVMHNGSVTRTDTTMRRLTLDVDVKVLTKILFSDPETGRIFNLPTERAMMPLMLD